MSVCIPVLNSVPPRRVLREPRPAVPEEHVVRMWLGAAHPSRVFTARAGETVRVIDPGRRNRHDGPDFLDATVVVDGVLRRGSVEVHVREGDWRRHGHDRSARYERVVLHVCLYAEGEGGGAPVVVLASQMDAPLRASWAQVRRTSSLLRCATPRQRPGTAEADAMLILAAAERFARKCGRIRARADALSASLPRAGAFRQAVYEAVFRAVGYGGNEDAFEQLARAVPLSALAATRRAARFTLLADAAGIPPAASRPTRTAAANDAAANGTAADDEKIPVMDPAAWNASGVLPGNRPVRRLRWLSDWAVRLDDRAWWRRCIDAVCGGAAGPETLRPLFTAQVRTGEPGPERVFELAVNVLAPVLFVHGRATGRATLARHAAALFHTLSPAPENRHTRAVARALEQACGDAGRQQGMIELATRHCAERRCRSCLLGRWVQDL